MKKWMIAAFLCGSLIQGRAQKVELLRFEGFPETMLQPKATLEEMMAEKAGADFIDKKIASNYKTIDGALFHLYQPIYERYQRAAGSVASLTIEEKAFTTEMKQGSKGLSGGVQFDVFKMLMARRSLVSGGKPLWSNVTVAKSTSLQQLKSLEAGFDWKAFHQVAESYQPKFGDIDPAIEVLNKKLTADIEKLPKIKVTMAAGITSEMEDPEQVIRLWRQHGADKQKAFAKQYSKVYTWWNAQYVKLKLLAEMLDAMAAKLQGGDLQEMKAAQPFFIDLQIRTWEALYRLAAVSQRLYNDTLIAMASEQQVEQMVSMYTTLGATAKIRQKDFLY